MILSMDKKTVLKLLGCVLTAAAAIGMLLLLTKQVGVSNQVTEINPPLFDSPSYVEPGRGGVIRVLMRAKEDATLGEFKAVMVNTDSSGSGMVRFTMTSGTNELWSTEIPESAITIGEWFGIGNPATYIESGQAYEMLIEPVDCEPYFIKTQLFATNKVLPFEESVFLTGGGKENEELDCGISLGTAVVSDKPLTYGDTFYFSRSIVVLTAIVVICIIIFGHNKVLGFFTYIWDKSFVIRFGNEILLLLMFITFCLSIYVNGYLEGVNISADSAGYLREAVNLHAGKGFHYDALAGYESSWFANWPILYPAMIALVMKITGLEVYLSSKILSMILVGILLGVLYKEYGKKAWIYALCATNLGLMYLYWYSWSELPFIIFITLFALRLYRILQSDSFVLKDCILLGCFMVLAFLTRYFGIFLFGVAAFSIFIIVLGRISAMLREKKDNKDNMDAADKHRLWSAIKTILGGKVMGLIATCGISGVICLLYLINNKIRNGMPSGVSRSMWWDDYVTLTNDLIKALVAEFFNIFHTEVPSYIAELKPSMEALFVITVLSVTAIYIIPRIKGFSRASVLIMTSVIYYGMFIVIRYFSSMDTFYYRFFAPATFLFTLGLTELIVNDLTGGSDGDVICKTNGNIVKTVGFFAGAFLLVISVSYASDHIAGNNIAYYDIIKMNWDEDYAEIPQKSVVIFSTLDFRSLYYRPDVTEGLIGPEDNMESINNKYYGSDHMCILTSDAKIMAESGIYDPEITNEITDALKTAGKYCVIDMKH